MTNRDQAEFWTAQQAWVDWAPALDATLQPVLELLMDRAALQPGQRVLDVGCGTGASVLAAAKAVGPDGHVLGADISATLLARARQRTAHLPQVTLAELDAAAAPLPTGPFDVLISRFGVMFFDDTPGAFAALARALRPGAPLVMAAWGAVFRNPWFMEPGAAARARFADLPRTDRSLPGPFAFEDPARVIADLTAAGLSEVQVEEVPLMLTPADGLAEAVELSLNIGPAAGALRQCNGTSEDRAALRADLTQRFAAHQTPDGMRIPALINLITARNPA